MRNPVLATLERDLGIVFMGSQNIDFQKEGIARNLRLAQDAQPALITVSNSGIPAYLTTFIDPKLIKVLLAPMNAAKILGGEVKKGDWLTDTAMFAVIESTGQTSAYGDYNNNGHVGTNFDFPQRQSFHYQVITEWGEREMERAGLAKIDYANALNVASAIVLNKFQNGSYFYGIANLQNYGLLNSPDLIAPIAPTTEPTNLILWKDKDAIGVLADIAALFTQLQSQANGLVELDTPMVLAMSPGSEARGLTKTNNFNVNVMDLIKKNYPNLRVETAPEYATASGELLQLIVEELDGQKTAEPAFTEKMRAHPVVVGLSNWSQKKSQGTWGTVIYRPFLIAQMLGV